MTLYIAKHVSKVYVKFVEQKSNQKLRLLPFVLNVDF